MVGGGVEDSKIALARITIYDLLPFHHSALCLQSSILKFSYLMLRTWNYVLLLIGLTALPGLQRPAAAQDISIQASVDRNVVSQNGQVVYTIEVEGASLSEIETPEPPATEGLTLLQSTPTTRRNISFYNGQMQQAVSFEWRFRPLTKGTAHIEAAHLRVKGETYQTADIRLTVVSSSQVRGGGQRAGNRSGRSSGASGSSDEDERGVSEKDLFIQATPSSRQTYRNEQVAITYHLYFREGVQVRQSRLADSWDAEGFWREELEVDPRPVPRHLVENGLRYRQIVLKRAAVFPARAGSLTVDPLRIETEAYAARRTQGNLFQRFFTMGDKFNTIERASPPVALNVKPLPSGAPASFNGAVGSFHLEAQARPDEVEVGEAVKVEVRLSGTGNIATLEPPVLTSPDVFETYDPEIETSINRQGERIRGTRTFTYVLVPRSNGTFEMPPIRFSYFDPAAERYKTLTADLAPLRVTGTAAPPPASASTHSGLPVDDIAGPMAEAGRWRRIDRTPLHRSPWTYAALAMPLLLVMGFYTYQRHANRLATDIAYARRRRAHPAARRHLKKARQLMDSDEQRAFYAELQRAVMGFIGNRLNLAERGLTRRDLDDHLQAAGVPGRTRAALDRLLASSDKARFAPGRSDRTAMEAALHRAEDLIADLDKAFSREAAEVTSS